MNVCILNAANIQVFRSKQWNGDAEINLVNEFFAFLAVLMLFITFGATDSHLISRPELI